MQELLGGNGGSNSGEVAVYGAAPGLRSEGPELQAESADERTVFGIAMHERGVRKRRAGL
jgi:hypothetical protein